MALASKTFFGLSFFYFLTWKSLLVFSDTQVISLCCSILGSGLGTDYLQNHWHWLKVHRPSTPSSGTALLGSAIQATNPFAGDKIVFGQASCCGVTGVVPYFFDR
jgi:hypothetical protein